MDQVVVVEVFRFWKDIDDEFRKEPFGLYRGVVPIWIDSCKRGI